MGKISRDTTIAMVAVVVVVLIMATFVVASNAALKTSYVVARADRTSYTIGEDITFKVVSQNSLLANFRSTGFPYDNGVYVTKVPDYISVDELLANSTYYSNMLIWPGLLPQVTFYNFNSDSGPLGLRWDGTFQVRNKTLGEMERCLATSGYYFLYPKLFVTDGNAAVYPRIDRSSIFYLNSLNVSVSLSYQDSTRDLTLDLNISDPLGHVTNGSLVSSMRHNEVLDEQPYSNVTLEGSTYDHLNASVELTGGRAWVGSLVVQMSPLASRDFEYAGTVSTEQGRFAFGVMGAIDGEGGVRIYYIL